MVPLWVQIYNKKTKVCVVSYLTNYLERLKKYRDTDKLYLTCSKPYRAASKGTNLGGVSQLLKRVA